MTKTKKDENGSFKPQRPEISFGDDKATKEWMSSLNRSTRRAYGTIWRLFVQYTKMNGDQILDSRKADKEFTWEKTVIGFKKWVQTEKELSDNTAKTAAAGVRGFFAFHRVPLQFRRQESQQLTQAKRKTEDYRFSRDDLKRMVDVSDLNEKYVLIAGKSFGLRAGDFLKLTRGDLEPYINREPPICIGPIDTEKESVKAFPFIDIDALPIIKIVLEKMSREGRANPEERIVTFEREITLSRVLKRLADKAGIEHGNKVVRFHCLRKFLIDRLASHMSESKWKQIVGKKISEGAYVSPDSLREDYSRAMAETTFTLRPDLEKRQQIVERLTNKLIAGESFNEEDKRQIKEYGIQLRETAHKRPRTEIDCPDGVHCGEDANERLSRSSNFGEKYTYEQIPESRLLEPAKRLDG